MIGVRLAELNIGIENQYDYIEKMCRGYLTDEACDFSVSASESEIEAEDKGNHSDRGYLESLAVYRKIAEILPEYNGFLLHGVVMDFNGCGIAFLARSGVGKSTHARLWCELFGDNVKIINGDKPLLRIIGNKAFAYGTPWAGKENQHINAKTELKKICFIERGIENQCIRLEKGAVFELLINQIYFPKNNAMLLKTLEIINDLIEHSEFYLIKCNKDISAAKTAAEGIGV